MAVFVRNMRSHDDARITGSGCLCLMTPDAPPVLLAPCFLYLLYHLDANPTSCHATDLLTLISTTSVISSSEHHDNDDPRNCQNVLDTLHGDRSHLNI